MKDFDFTTKCPHCGTTNPASFNCTNDQPPDTGDLAMCIACGRWGVFDEALALRKPTSEELGQLARSGMAVRAHLAWIAATAPKEKSP